jgi:hypothetical protein
LKHPTYHANWIENEVLCNPSTSDCILFKCDKCSSGSLFFQKYISVEEVEPVEEVVIKQWQTEDSGYLVRKSVLYTVGQAIDTLRTTLPKFLLHHLTKRQQASKYRLHKENIDKSTIVIHFDFSENYSCSWQDETQGAYYSHKLVSIFTSVIYTSNSHRSFIICSDNINHTKSTVLPYLVEIFEVRATFLSILLCIKILFLFSAVCQGWSILMCSSMV